MTPKLSAGFVLRSGLVSMVAMAMVATGCAHTRLRYEARAGAGQQLFYENGQPKLVSMKRSSIVSVLPAQKKSDNGNWVVVVGVGNNSSQPVTIATEQVSANQNGAALRVFSYDELAQEEESRQQRAQMFQVAGAVLGGVSAGLGASTGSFSSLANTNALSIARTQTETMMQATSREVKSAEINLVELEKTALRTNTIFPGQFGGGAVHIVQPKPGPIHLHIQVGEDAHEFDFSVVETQS